MRLTRTFVFMKQVHEHIETMIEIAQENEPPCGVAFWLEQTANEDYRVETEFYEQEAEADAGVEGAEGSGESAPIEGGALICEDDGSADDDAIRIGSDAEHAGSED